MSRFNVSKEQLPGYIQNALLCIEAQTPLRFTSAEDWTNQLQGWVLKFTCDDCHKVFENKDKVEFTIKAQFCHNPSIKCVEEDSSDFEELEYVDGNNFRVYLSM